MNSIMKLCWLVPLFIVRSSAQDDLTCDLQCRNDGKCVHKKGTLLELEKMASRGLMIQECECPKGYGGTGCEIPFPECNEEGLCADGSPCILRKDGVPVCDCHVYDAVDEFAGELCRRPTTEYCGAEFRFGDMPYCTNGGKCYSSFLAVHDGKGGDTALRDAYSHMGCICNPHFDGPHCEYLKHSMEDIPRKNPIEQVEIEDGEKESFFGALKSGDVGAEHLAIGSVVLFFFASLFVLFRSHRKHARDISNSSDGNKNSRVPLGHTSALVEEETSIYLDDGSRVSAGEQITSILGVAGEEEKYLI